MMDEATFWKIIDESRQRARKRKRPKTTDFIDVHIEELTDCLRKLTPEEIVSFDRRFDHYHNLAYRWDLWAAAYWLGGGCSDDGFIDFRSTLISLGRERFHQVLKGPDSIADLLDEPDMPYMQSEGFQYVAGRVYEEKTGEEMPIPKGAGGPRKPAGKQLDHDDEEVMAKHFPKLVAKLPDMGD